MCHTTSAPRPTTALTPSSSSADVLDRGMPTARASSGLVPVVRSKQSPAECACCGGGQNGANGDGGQVVPRQRGSHGAGVWPQQPCADGNPGQATEEDGQRDTEGDDGVEQRGPVCEDGAGQEALRLFDVREGDDGGGVAHTR